MRPLHVIFDYNRSNNYANDLGSTSISTGSFHVTVIRTLSDRIPKNTSYNISMRPQYRKYIFMLDNHMSRLHFFN